MSQRHVLVTGGAGFIGSHLVEHLLDKGYAVRVVDDFSTGSLANLRHAIDRGCRVIESDAAEALASLDDEPIHAIYHLAASVGVTRVVSRPVETIRNNLRTSEAAIDAALRHACPLLMASSSEVYGPSRTERVLSESNPVEVGPADELRWGYALTKAIDEQLALATHQTRGLDVRVVRFFNTIGPRQVGDYGMVVPRMVQNALKGEPLIVYGDGSQTRCFCDVADVVRGLEQLMSTPASNGQVINIGHDEPVRIDTLAECVIDVTASSSPIERVSYASCPDRLGEPQQRRPDLTKLRRLIQWEPRFTLRESLVRIRSWMLA